jgi:predicted dehydrogenase
LDDDGVPGAGRPLRWGVLSTAKIGREKVIPGLQASASGVVEAIASRELGRARRVAGELGIARAYGSYEELLADPEVDAVYNPLPNHLHVPWSIRAAEAGKHVLCEKPIGLDAGEARQLLEARDRTGVVIGEAFMIRTHPQWLDVRDRVRAGELGELRLVSCHFSYYNDDPANIRARPEWGGGGVLDIGCYAVHVSRWLFDAEPTRVISLMEWDPDQGVDTLASAILDFGGAHGTFTCGTRVVPYQRVQLLGTTGRIEVEIPFNAPPDRPCRIRIDGTGDPGGSGERVIEHEAIDQYAAQGDAFARAVHGAGPVPVPLEDAVANMAVLDALFRSENSGRWEPPTP